MSRGAVAGEGEVSEWRLESRSDLDPHSRVAPAVVDGMESGDSFPEQVVGVE